MRRAALTGVATVWLLCGLWSAGLPGQGGQGPGAAREPARPGGRKFVVAVLNRVTWHDLLDEEVKDPTLRQLAQHGAVGMMCVRTARGKDGAYLTIGAGARAFCSGSMGRSGEPEGYAFQAQEWVEGTSAQRLYQAYTGSPSGGNAILHLGIGEMMGQNLEANHPVRVGLLGGTLRQAGLRVACVGNADTPQGPHREIVTLAMDEQGLVGSGNVGASLLRPAPGLPYQVTTDGPRFLKAFAEAVKGADVVFLELGETARVAEYADRVTPADVVGLRRQAIEKSDRLLGQALSLMPEKGWAVLVVTPSLRAPDPEEWMASLAPVVLAGPEAESGVLTSASTRRAGVVVNSDIAATVLEYYGIPRPDDTVGRPITTVAASGNKLKWLAGMVRRQDDTEWARKQVLRWLPIVAVAGLWSAAFLLLLGERAPYWPRVVVRGLLGVALAAPLTAVLVGAYPTSGPVMLALVVAGALVIALVSGWATSWRSVPVACAVMLVLCLAYDVLRGQNLLEWSPFSYSAAGGARFYGIGNELAGALLGAGLVAVAGALGSRAGARWGRRCAAAAVLVGLAVMVGYPMLGANFGMLVACAVGFGAFVLYLWRDEPGWREVAAVGVAMFGLVVAAVIVDVLARGGRESHVGMLVQSWMAQGWPAVWQTASGKMAMNLALVKSSTWTYAAASALTVLGVALVAKPAGVIAALREQEWLLPAVVAGLVGAVTAFLVEDTGVIAGGVVLLYVVGALAYAALGGGRR